MKKFKIGQKNNEYIKFNEIKNMRLKLFPFLFIILWSSAFITTKPIIDNSEPFTALAFRFAIVAVGFFLFSISQNNKLSLKEKNF